MYTCIEGDEEFKMKIPLNPDDSLDETMLLWSDEFLVEELLPWSSYFLDEAVTLWSSELLGVASDLKLTSCVLQGFEMCLKRCF